YFEKPPPEVQLVTRAALTFVPVRVRADAKKENLPQLSPAFPPVTHAVVVIFLEFFAWGLLTTPMLTVLRDVFPQHTFLMNGLVQGVKGFLSFLSAPLIGALSDIWGRKSFLLMTVFFTCAPIPFMKISPW
uniref:Major facilitator superfamily (MFS) profile domain-containing protein n=1 Tax=Haplochromis burtoni TaxID=8153 RepID=A0A3Q3CKC5_HAPBU